MLKPMCLVLIGWRAHPEYRLIVAANRDEFYTRPTESLRWWPEVTGLLAGRDLHVDTPVPGSWLGLVPRDRRFATVTNVYGPREHRTDARSRGALPMAHLRDVTEPEKFVHEIAAAPDDYNGYNLVVSDLESLWWHSNRSAATPLALAPGLHGLSNGAMLGSSDLASPHEIRTESDAPAWPKVREGLRGLRTVIETDPGNVSGYLRVLADRTVADDHELPDTGLPPRHERAVSARFVADLLYGTRCSTVLLIREDGAFSITERSFGHRTQVTGEASFTGTLELTRSPKTEQ
ncbi:NRDE family protein [Nocardia sp. NPDC006044]|uniref:NRDE family protein n=1 Tax=Nocardia sp. NPDC006044 TaxID=3364306 RepID=UPI0036AE3843